MFGRAVTAFRKSVTKSKSSNTITNSDKDDNDYTCDESIISISSSSVGSCVSGKHRRFSLTSTPSARLSLLKRQRRSQSANREGD